MDVDTIKALGEYVVTPLVIVAIWWISFKKD